MARLPRPARAAETVEVHEPIVILAPELVAEKAERLSPSAVAAAKTAVRRALNASLVALIAAWSVETRSEIAAAAMD